MKKITIRWLDVDGMGTERGEERTLEGEKVGHQIDPDSAFVKIWADEQTLVIARDRVVLLEIK